MKTHIIPALALAVVLTAASQASAATASASSTAPAVNEEDIANIGAVSGTDKWFSENSGAGAAKGQTFTTGGAAVKIKAITYQVADGNSAAPTKTYVIRLGKVTGTVFTQVHSETATQNFTWSSGQYMTWTLDTPNLLEPYTTYGIDVGMTASTSSWTTGIPYLNFTTDEYAGGTQYNSGTSGVGNSSVGYVVGSDRLFHLDIERPLGPVFQLAATSPLDNAANAFANRNLVLTFSQDVTPGTGDLTIRNLTDNTQVALPANDSRLTYDQNVVRIDPAGLLAWDKNYAIRIDAGMFLGDGDAPIPAITDDTTWNFTTLANDPLLAAIAAIKAHILNTTPLTGSQISAHKTTIDANRERFAENTAIISAVFDLISTYDTAKGPIFVSGFSTNATSFDRNYTTGTTKNYASPENYHWVVYTVMQHAMDVIYTAENLAKYEATLTNYKFGSHTSFPGPCSPPSNPLNTHTVSINGSFPITFGRNTQMWTVSARKPTGTYLAPGTIATVTVPPALVNSDYKIRVGAHAWDLSYRRPVNRLERASRLYPITSTTTKIASPYGGGIYIEVPIGANAGVVSVTVTGGVRSPYFSAKSFHQTTPAEWDVEKTHTAPWADFQSDKFMCQVPRKWIYNMTGTQATQLMVDWDKAMDAINSLMGFDLNRGKETMYCQSDVILRSSVHAPGYPAVNVTSNVNSEVSPAGYAGNYLVRGPNTTLTASNIEFHEQGHGYGFPKFGGESESNVNLLQPAMLYRAFGRTIDEAQNGSFGGGNPFITVDTTAIAWMCVFSFSPNEIPMQQLEKQYQHKGHAKWMDIARIYATPSNPNAGWEKLDAYWRSFMLDDAANISYGTGTDDLLLRLSRHVGKDIRPLFHFWGIHPQNPSALAAALAAENLNPDPAIKAKLLHYKSIVPADNAAFRSFAQSWWGRKPTVAGAWEETDHAMQWDETLDADGSNNPSVRPTITTGSKYVEGCAAEIRARIDELVDLYFPTGMTPATMSFTVAPTAVDATTVTMTAITVTAASPPVQYYFENTTTNTNSGWISTPTWTQTGLTTDQSYSYKVKARDAFNVENNESPLATVNLTSAGDISPPSPDPMTFAIAPAAEDEQSITMTATAASDVNGVQYYFENITNSTNSGWQDSPVYTEINLQPLTSYTYRVRARDKSPGQNATAFSANATASTADLPDETPPTFTGLSPADGTLVSNLGANLVVTFDEPVIAASGSITLKNLTDATETVFNIGDPAVTVSGNTLTLNPPADLAYGKDYAVQISNNAVGDLSNNPFSGINDDSTWNFTAILVDPIANPGGPYVVPLLGSLALDGSASAPSHLQSIVSYEWDLNNDGTFGDVTGATPAAITESVLTSTWGMSVGLNTIGLRVTDSAAKTATATTTVKIGIVLTWDANGTTASQTDGAGAWLNANQWWDAGVNTGWTSGAAAIFGNGGVGGAVTLASPTTVASLTFNSYITTGYTLGTAGQTITLNNGITKNAGGVTATIVSPITLGGAQTWTNNSTGALSPIGTLNLGANTLTFGGTGNFSFAVTGTSTISGTGGIIKNGTGILTLSSGGTAQNHSYTGTTTINGGTVMIGGGNKPTGNFNLNGGMLTDYFQSTYAWTGGLGTGNNQIQIYGDSGFGGGNGASTWRIGTAGSVLTWGSVNFSPNTLKFMTPADNLGPSTYGQAILDNGLDLNGATRTIEVLAATGANALNTFGRINGVISNGSLIKTGAGHLVLNSAANTYAGATTISAGTLSVGTLANGGSNSGIGSSNAAATNLLLGNGATFRYTGAAVSTNRSFTINGTASGHGAALDASGSGAVNYTATTTPAYGTVDQARTLTLTGTNTGSNTLAALVTDNGTGAVSLTKSGTGTWILSNAGNNYTGPTTLAGGLLQGVIPGGIGTSGGTSALIFNGGVLGLTTGDFTRSLGTNTTVTAANFTGAGGWAAYGADRNVNLGGASAQIVWATPDTGFNAQTLILGASSATHKVTLQNGLDLGTAVRTVQTDDGTGAVDGELSGVITGGAGGGLTKTGTGTLSLSNANTYTGVTTVSGGVLLLDNANALPGGIGSAGGTSALTFNGGIVGLTGDFTRSLAAAGTVTAATFTGTGGWAAYGADRIVNLGGASTPITWATAGTGFNNQTLILGTASATHTVDLQNPLLVTTMRTVQVDNGSAAVDAKLSGNISGTGGGISKTGGGTLAITGNMSQTGGLTVSGNGSTLNLSGTNTYSGTTTVGSGNPNSTLVIQGSQALSPNTTVNFVSNSTPAGTLKLLDDTAGTIILPNTLTQDSANATINFIVFVGNNNTANGGTSAGTTTGSTISLNKIAATSLSNSKTIYGLKAEGANNYTLGISNVEIPAFSAATFTSATGWKWQLAANSAPISITGTVQQLAGSTSTTLTSQTLELTGTNTGSNVSGNILNSLDGTPRPLTVLKAGTGTWTLSGNSTYTGSTTISDGTLVGIGANAFGSTSGISIAGSKTLSLRGDSNTSFVKASDSSPYTVINTGTGATINVDRVTGTGAATMTIGNLTTTSTSGTWQLNFTGANGASLNAGALTTPTATTASHTINNNIAGGGSLTLAGVTGGGTGAAATLIFTGSANTTVSGAITQTATNQALTKSGTGTLLLNGANSYTGLTTVSAGTLGGTGSIAGSVTVAAAGSLAPGASAGTLSIGGGLDISAPVNGGAGKLNFELGPIAASDKLAVTGTLTIGTAKLGFSDFVFSPLVGLQNGTYKLITSGGISGTLDTVPANLAGAVGGGTGTLQIAGNDLELVITGIGGGTPEIAVDQGGNINNGDAKGFGAVTLGSNNSLVFTINNTGTAALNLSGSPLVAVSGTNAGDFIITSTPASSVAAAGSTTFTVQFAPSASGVRNAVLTIANDDSDEGTFTINVSGTGQTPYEAWSGGAAFDGDANNDGVKNGLAFLLGASSANATVTLPTVNQSGGNLVLTFQCRNDASRGSAKLHVENSSDLGKSDAWVSALVTDAGVSGPGVSSSVTPGSPNNTVTVTISSSEAVSGKLFARLQAAP